MSQPTSIVGLCVMEFYLPGLNSLKDKRSILKPMLTRLRNTFNVSTAEVGHHDVWQSAAIAVATVTNTTVHANQVIDNVIKWIEDNYPDAVIVKQNIEIL
jgi:uncharacterized protein